MRVIVIHGPNLNLLGTREQEIYGSITLEELDATLAAEAASLGIELDTHQTAREGEFIELLHNAVGSADAAVVNPGAYSHTSRAIADAIRAVPYPVIEVHLSNIHAREGWRRTTVTGEAARGVITGLGVGSYLAALHELNRGS